MSRISLCDTCSNCECIFQTGVVREQCDFYIEKTEYCRAIDDVLEIIDTVNDDLDFGTKAKGVALSIKEKVLALKGEQDDKRTLDIRRK